MFGRSIKGISSLLTKNIFYQAASKAKRDPYCNLSIYIKKYLVSIKIQILNKSKKPIINLHNNYILIKIQALMQDKNLLKLISKSL